MERELPEDGYESVRIENRESRIKNRESRIERVIRVHNDYVRNNHPPHEGERERESQLGIIFSRSFHIEGPCLYPCIRVRVIRIRARAGVGRMIEADQRNRSEIVNKSFRNQYQITNCFFSSDLHTPQNDIPPDRALPHHFHPGCSEGGDLRRLSNLNFGLCMKET